MAVDTISIPILQIGEEERLRETWWLTYFGPDSVCLCACEFPCPQATESICLAMGSVWSMPGKKRSGFSSDLWVYFITGYLQTMCSGSQSNSCADGCFWRRTGLAKSVWHVRSWETLELQKKTWMKMTVRCQEGKKITWVRKWKRSHSVSPVLWDGFSRAAKCIRLVCSVD